MNARDELAKVIESGYGEDLTDCPYDHAPVIADAVLIAGYRKIFDGDCGLSNVKDATEREAAEAWMRWANLVNTGDGEPNGIAAMQQMLTELGYRKPRTIMTLGDLAGEPDGTVIRTAHGKTMELFAGYWSATDSLVWWSPIVDWLPATVLHEPEARS